ncbi:MAG: type II toxin-antitoxin system VapC family toxin [Dehalococcoidia bacterium]|nr:type II toxin-antitoxin system VapC family toxin [Dehalococcoidia bacterium]
MLREPDPDAAAAKLQVFLDTVPVLPFSAETARRCASLRETLRRQGKQPNRRALDLLIAATALEHDLIMVTANTQDYDDIPGLQLYYSS